MPREVSKIACAAGIVSQFREGTQGPLPHGVLSPIQPFF